MGQVTAEATHQQDTSSQSMHAQPNVPGTVQNLNQSIFFDDNRHQQQTVLGNQWMQTVACRGAQSPGHLLPQQGAHRQQSQPLSRNIML
jgi:hypothetical protein